MHSQSVTVNSKQVPVGCQKTKNLSPFTVSSLGFWVLAVVNLNSNCKVDGNGKPYCPTCKTEALRLVACPPEVTCTSVRLRLTVRIRPDMKICTLSYNSELQKEQGLLGGKRPTSHLGKNERFSRSFTVKLFPVKLVWYLSSVENEKVAGFF
jgi:hypothetical protein